MGRFATPPDFLAPLLSPYSYTGQLLVCRLFLASRLLSLSLFLVGGSSQDLQRAY